MSEEERRNPAPGSFERWLRGFLNKEGNDLLDRTLAEHAHELAEKIRNDREPWEWALAGQHAGNDAADLIDPDKEGSADGAEAGRA